MNVDDENEFKIPSIIPQDLQLIQDIIGELPVSKPHIANVPKVEDDEGIESSDNDTDSEKEVEDDILAGVAEDEGESQRMSGPLSSADTESSSDSSDSDSEDDIAAVKPSNDTNDDDIDEDEDAAGPSTSASSQFRTKNEVPEPEITVTIPAMEEVESDEELEKVGEVMSILNGNVVVVKGSSAGMGDHGRAAERALDSETLLVFGDRKVLGYVYETFGPTYQPMYQVKFNSQYPLDVEKVKVAKEVFHVPSRSNFVFVRQLRALKGSDASNAHDEEPGDDELEFSDDEAERTHKKAMERRREEARAGSSTSSRFSTPIPNPSKMRDQDIAAEEMYGSYDYASASYNDMDFGAGPSRPPPVPYDDPYSDQYGLDIPVASTSTTASGPDGTSTGGGESVAKSMNGSGDVKRSPSAESRVGGGGFRGRGGRREDRGRGRGRDRGGRRGGDRGRGRGRGRGGGSGSGSGGNDDRSWGNQSPQNNPQAGYSPTEEYDPRQPRPLSPTSVAIARATGQYDDTSSYNTYSQYSQQQPHGHGQGWGYVPTPQSFDFGYGYPQGYVQPHINPRFASQFGLDLNMGYVQQQSQQQPYAYGADYAVPTPTGGDGAGNWAPGETRNVQNGQDQGGSLGS